MAIQGKAAREKRFSRVLKTSGDALALRDAACSGSSG
jgi:hypothetical protein